jgi:hypothetical protein
MRDREHDVEVRHREQLGLTLFEPSRSAEVLALGTVAVPAGVVGQSLEVASLAMLAVSTQLRRPTRLDGVHDALLEHGRSMLTAIRRAVPPQDVRDLEAWP